MSHCAVQNILLVTKNETALPSSVPRSTYRWLAGQAWHAEYNKTDGKVVSRFITVRDHIGFGGLDKARWLWWHEPLVPEEWGDCSAQRRGGGIPRKGTVSKAAKSEARSRGRMAQLRAGAYSQGSHRTHRPHFLTHSPRASGRGSDRNGSPLEMSGGQPAWKHLGAVGMERRAERATVAEDWKDSLGALDGERPPPFWGHSWFQD